MLFINHQSGFSGKDTVITAPYRQVIGNVN